MAFGADAMTARYIDGLGAEAQDKAANHTVGSHWLLLWGLVVAAIVTWLIVRSRVSLLGLLALPVTNNLSRLGESEADAYSLRTVGEPDGLASALVKTAEYRYPRPHSVQEAGFYTHPSVERRVRRAMEWKAARAGRGQ